jgi:hypothetical protein
VLLLVWMQQPGLASATTFVNLAPPMGLARSTQSFGATIADFNGDGRPDVLLNRQAQGPPTLYLQGAMGRSRRIRPPCSVPSSSRTAISTAAIRPT